AIPSSAQRTPSTVSHAIVVRRPPLAKAARSAVFTSRKHPVPYVFFASPAAKHVWPKSAACWSPATPAMGRALPQCCASASATIPLDPPGVAGIDRAQSLADGSTCTALPDDGGMDRTARRTLPHDGRLALVRNADRGDLARIESRTGQGFAPDRDGRGEDLLGIVLDVGRRGIELSYLAVGASPDGAGLVQDDRARARRPLVERQDRGHSVLKRRIGSTSRR